MIYIPMWEHTEKIVCTRCDTSGMEAPRECAELLLNNFIRQVFSVWTDLGQVKRSVKLTGQSKYSGVRWAGGQSQGSQY